MRKVTALKSAMEEAVAAREEDRKEILQLQQKLEQAGKDKERMRQWVRTQDERAKASHEHWLALAQDMQALLGEVNQKQGAGAEAGAGSGNLTLTEKELVEALKAKPADMKKAIKELDGLEAAKTAKPGTAEKVAPRLLALRALLHELRGAVGKRLEEQQEKQSEEEAKEGDAKMEAQLQSLAEALQSHVTGNGIATDANSLASCAHTVMDLGTLVRSQRLAARRSATKLAAALEQALASPSSSKLSKSLQEQLNSTLETCQLANPRAENASLCAPLTPEYNETAQSCSRMGCRCSATAEEISQYLNYTERQVSSPPGA